MTLAGVIKKRRIDLLHSHGLLATYYCEMARTLGSRVPLVYHQHGFHHHNHGRLTRRARIAAERWLAGRAEGVIAVSSSDHDQLLAQRYVSESRLRLIHYGLPPGQPQPAHVEAARRALGITPGATVVGLVGRLHPQKGVDTFIRAVEIVRRSRPDIVFAIVGVGDLEQDLRALAASLGLGSELRWVTDGTPGVAAMRCFSMGAWRPGGKVSLLCYSSTWRPVSPW